MSSNGTKWSNFFSVHSLTRRNFSFHSHSHAACFMVEFMGANGRNCKIPSPKWWFYSLSRPTCFDDERSWSFCTWGIWGGKFTWKMSLSLDSSRMRYRLLNLCYFLIQVMGLSNSLNTNLEKGVCGDDADLQARRNAFGSNTYPRKQGKSFWVSWSVYVRKISKCIMYPQEGSICFTRKWMILKIFSQKMIGSIA